MASSDCQHALSKTYVFLFLHQKHARLFLVFAFNIIVQDRDTFFSEQAASHGRQLGTCFDRPAQPWSHGPAPQRKAEKGQREKQFM